MSAVMVAVALAGPAATGLQAQETAAAGDGVTERGMQIGLR